jgi:hypothetical protein
MVNLVWLGIVFLPVLFWVAISLSIIANNLTELLQMAKKRSQ